MDISLLQLRDLLTNYESSAALNAARAFEARQNYSELDAAIPATVCEAKLGRLIASEDAAAGVFHVQIKKLPPDLMDQWTPTAEYAVIHTATDWQQSYELKFQRLEQKRLEAEFSAAVFAEQDRRHRMAKAICARMPIPFATMEALFHQCPDEAHLAELVHQWEHAIDKGLTKIYELPTENPQGSQELLDPPEETAGRVEEAPGAGTETPPEVGDTWGAAL